MSLDTNISNLTTRTATEIKALRTLINGNAADLTALDTTATNTLVAAINEVLATVVGGGEAASTTVAGIVELATTGETTTGTDTTRAVTPAGVQAAVDALVASAPGALNTLDELAAALGDDANYAATITTALAGKQPLDADLTAIAAVASQTSYGQAFLALVDAAGARSYISTYSQAEIGSVTTNYVTIFEAGLV